MNFKGFVCIVITSFLIINNLNHVHANLTDIIGGTPADIIQHPYQVSLRSNNRFICGGIIIDERHILTAAHCVCNENYLPCPVPSETIKVAAGSTTLDPIKGVLIPVEQIFVHEKYLSTNVYANDIAVLRLSSALKFCNKIKAYPLAKSTPRDETVCVATGWGKTAINGNVSNKLMRVDLTVIGHKSCASTNDIFYKVLCTDRGGKKPWSGDSGGALNCGGEIAGIVSAGYISNEYPNYFTDIARYRSWIDIQLKRATSSNVSFNINYFFCVIIGRLIYSNLLRLAPFLAGPLIIIYNIFRTIFFWL